MNGIIIYGFEVHPHRGTPTGLHSFLLWKNIPSCGQYHECVPVHQSVDIWLSTPLAFKNDADAAMSICVQISV